MKVTLADARLFKDSLMVVSELVTETVIEVSPENVKLVAMDPANAAMIIFRMDPSAFVEYDVKTSYNIGIDLGQLKQILKRVKGTEPLTLELEENQLKVTIMGRAKRTFYLPIREIEGEERPTLHDLQFGAEVVMSSDVLADVIEDAKIVADSVTFEVQDDKLIIFSRGDLGKADIEIPAGEDVTINKTAEGEIRSKYSLEYLSKMIKARKISELIVIKLGNDYPMQLEFNADNKAEIAFVLAPRMDLD